jgi:hypothetical protein
LTSAPSHLGRPPRLDHLEDVADSDSPSIQPGEFASCTAFAKYELVPGGKVAAMDIVLGRRRIKAIYELKGDDLEICFFEAADRPEDFDFSAGIAYKKVLYVLKRQRE